MSGKPGKKRAYNPERSFVLMRPAMKKIRAKSRDPHQPIDLPGPMIHHAITENA